MLNTYFGAGFYAMMRPLFRSRRFWLMLALVFVIILQFGKLTKLTSRMNIYDGTALSVAPRSPVLRTLGQGYSVSGSKTDLTHVVFFMVNTAGSLTTQNILLRIGVSRNLAFLHAGVEDIACGGFSNCRCYNRILANKNILLLPADKGFDIMCSNLKYNKNSTQKYHHANTINIGIVSEPVARLASTINDFKILDKEPLPAYANDPAKYDQMMLKNRMALDFDFSNDLFPKSPHNKVSEIARKEALSYTHKLGKEFSLIIVEERFCESLVLLKRMLKLTTKDILYRITDTATQRTVDANDLLKFKDYLYLDYMLYDFAVKDLERKILKEGESLINEVEYFSELNKKVNLYCSNEWSVPIIVEANMWHDAFGVDRFFCETIMKTDKAFIKEIRN